MCNLIILVGYRGVGKTTIGRELADSIGYDFCDTDDEVVRLHKASIVEIVAREGWQAFRQYEKEVLQSLKEREKTVVATGGGAILHQTQWRELKDAGLIFWLSADEMVLQQRLEKDMAGSGQRPPLTERAAAEEIAEVLRERIPLYRQTAHYQIDTGKNGIAQAVKQIRQLLSQNSR